MEDREETVNEWDSEAYDQGHAFVFEHGEAVVDLLDPGPGERVLDLGCGTGHLTAQIAKSGATVVGLDASQEMVRTAQASQSDCDFVRGDARDFSFGEPFDAVFSNAALHWISDQDAVFRSVYNALCRGGRFVAELGGSGNVESIVDAIRAEAADRGYAVQNPWQFPSIGEYTSKLESHGFEPRYATLFDRPTELDGDTGLAEWIGMFGDTLLSAVPEAEQSAVISGVEDRLRGDRYRHGRWVADYRRLRFVAVKSQPR